MRADGNQANCKFVLLHMCTLCGSVYRKVGKECAHCVVVCTVELVQFAHYVAVCTLELEQCVSLLLEQPNVCLPIL